MEKYNTEQFKSDLVDPNVPHAKDRERFRDFYNELGKDVYQMAQDYREDGSFFVEPKGTVIELGCHWGFNLIRWADAGHRCVGVDISQTLLEYGAEVIKRLPPHIGKNISLVCGFIEDLEVTEKFDTVVLTETLEHVIDPLAVLKKGIEFMKDDALMYISVPNKKVGNNSHLRGFTFGELYTLITENGLSLEKFYPNVDISDPHGRVFMVAKKI